MRFSRPTVVLVLAVLLRLHGGSSAEPTTEECDGKACEAGCEHGDGDSCFRAAWYYGDEAGKGDAQNAADMRHRARELARKGCRAGHLGSCWSMLRTATDPPPSEIYWPNGDKARALVLDWLWCEHKQREPRACAALFAATDALHEQCRAGVADACWRLHHYYRRELGAKLDAAENQHRGKIEKTDAELAEMMREQACVAAGQVKDCPAALDTIEHPDVAVTCEAGTSPQQTATETACVDGKGTREGPARESYAWGDLQCTGRYRSGRKDGPWRCYWPDGSPQSTGAFVDGRMDGQWQFSYEGLGKAVAVSFRKDVPHGAFATWHAGGQRAVEGRFVDGMPDGTWTYWHPNGAPRVSGRFADGFRSGMWTGWYANGKMAVKMAYRGDVADGDYASWFDTGKPRDSGRYRKGKAVGRWSQTCTGTLRSGTYEPEKVTYGVSGDFCNLQLTF